jgi:type I restriction enzyme S subunit
MKPGYKQTEVGVIPQEWDVFSLSDLTEPQRPISYGIVQTGPNVPSGVRCLRVLDIHEGRINKTELITTSKEISDSYRRTVLRAGDLVMPLRGKVGDVGLVDDELHGANLTRGVALIAIRSGWSPVFCQQVISSASTRRRLEQAMNGSALQEIPIASLRSFKIATPKTLPEQRAIATALSDVDGLLGGLDRLIAKKRDLKQAAMQQLLTGQTRLPGFHAEWEVKRLGEIAHIKTGRRNNENKVEDGQYPFFVRSEVVERINSYSHECEAILVPGEGRIGDIFHYISGRFDVHQRVYAITKFVPGVSGRFIHFYLAKNFGAWAMQNTVKATVDSLRLPTFLTFEMHLPPTKAEQTAIAEVLTEMDGELAVLEQQREKTRALKQAMMQELLTGRTRLV